MAHDVFICYAKEDELVAEAICKALNERGIQCWYAKRDVLFGTPFEVSIIDAISKSRLMLLVLTSSSNASPHVTREIQNAFAEDVQVPVIPFRIEEVVLNPALKYYLRSVQWLDASTPPLESHLERLGDYIESHLPERKQSPVSEKDERQPAAQVDAARAEEERQPAAQVDRQQPQTEEEAVARDGQANEQAQREAEERDALFKPGKKRVKQLVLAACVLIIIGISVMWMWPRSPNPQSAADHVALGDVWSSQKKWDMAEAEYRRAVQMDPSHALWHHHLGDALFSQGKYEGAEAAYRKAVELDENKAEFQASLAFAQIRQKNWKDAAARLEKAVSLDKNQSPWFNQLGVCYYNLKNYQAAETAFRQLTEMVKGSSKKNNFAYYHANLGDAFYAQGKWADAISEYKEAVRLATSGPVISSEADQAEYQKRLDNAQKAVNLQEVTPPELLPRNYK